MSKSTVSALFLTCGSWHLPNTAKAFGQRHALAGLWMTLGNHNRIPAEKYRRAWPFQAAMLPIYKFAPESWVEHAFHGFFPLWKVWLQQQKFPEFNIAQAIMGYGTEAFDRAEKVGALKVLDCTNSHPVTYFGYWQRECDLWCPGLEVPIPRRMFARMTRELERADLVLCPSTFVFDTMVQNGIPARKCFLLPFGVDTSMFTPRPAAPQRPRFISVGAIGLRKGHQYLFRAWEIVKRKLPDAELVCVGPYHNDFRRERPKWEGSFIHRKGLRQAGVAELLKTCTAFVFPSQEEGLARAQIEAMASALPIIGTHEAGTTTLVQDGVHGFIVSGHDPHQIADAMIRVATDTAMNEDMGRAAHQKAAAIGSWQEYGDRLLAKYADVLRTGIS